MLIRLINNSIISFFNISELSTEIIKLLDSISYFDDFISETSRGKTWQMLPKRFNESLEGGLN